MSHKINRPKQKNVRKLLRNNPTPWEYKLWGYLKGKQLDGFKFRRQQGIENYVVDFCCPKVKLIIELDGSGHLIKSAIERDKKRQNDLERWGYTVIRFLNTELDENADAVLNIIADKCTELSKRTTLRPYLVRMEI